MNTTVKNEKIQELIKAGDIESCLNLIAEATDQDLADSLFLQLANEIERASGNFEKALAYAELLDKHYPLRPLGSARVAEDLLALGNKKEAYETIKKGIAKHPESPLILQVAALVARENNEFTESVNFSKRLIGLQPNRPLGFHNAAKALLKLKKFSECLAIIKQGVIRNPKNLLLLQLGIEAARALDNQKDISRFANQLIEHHPEEITGFTCMAQAYLQGGEIICASQIIQQGLQIHPENILLLQLGIEASRQQRKFIDSLTYSKKLITLHPDDPSGYLTHSQNLVELGREENALQAIQEGLQNHPENLLLLQQGVKESRKQQKFNESLAYSEKIITLYPSELSGYLTHTQNLISLGREREALQTISEGINNLRHDDQQNALLIQLGIEAARACNDNASAIKFGEMLVSTAPSEQVGYNNLARDLIEAGNIKKAESVINSFCKIDPKKEESIEFAREFYRATGNREKALILSKKLCNLFGETEKNLLEEASDLFALGHGKRSRIQQISKLISRSNDIATVSNFLEKKHSKGTLISHEIRSNLNEFNIFSHFNGDFNPTDLAAGAADTKKKMILCVIHTGKCAGESIIKTLQACTDPQETRICEFHVFDADIAINQALKTTKDSNQIHWIVLTRDPLTRWISAFNWDQHIFFFNTHLFGHKSYKKLFHQYKNARQLVRGLMRDQQSAFTLSRYEHLACGQMHMGQAWYLKERSIDDLPRNRTSIIRTEHIDKDFEKCIVSIKKQFQNNKINSNIKVEHTKNAYHLRYPAFTFTKKIDLKPQEVRFLKNFLFQDYMLHEFLIKHHSNDSN
tara:strand:- start:138 stop:2564 length:2427 start_codon:yes stop_codon:yes gene_type:complete